jgi:tetratricopeptide (TPR) repeat protein
LTDRYPAFRNQINKKINDPDTADEFSGQQIGELLANLSQRQWVYYLHPSFGSYFERVCMTPHRLGADLHPYPSNMLASLVLTPAEIATNQAYWHTLEKQSLRGLQEMAGRNADGLPARSEDALRIANYYSQMLDYWGTELQKSGTELKLPLLLNDAGDQFAEAFRLNPYNYMARINRQFNADLRKAPPPAGAPISSTDLADHVRSWEDTYNVDGPADVPDLDIRIGEFFAANGARLQAAHLFQRCLELAPNDAEAKLDLAKTCIDLDMVDAGFALIRDIRGRAAGDPLELARVEAMGYAKKNDFKQADKVLTEARETHPKDDNFAGITGEFYRLMGYSMLNEGKGGAAAEKDAAPWFRKALKAYDDQLQLVSSDPMKVTANAPEIPRINLRRTEMQMMLKDYPAAILILNAMVSQDPEKPVPLLNRAICELQNGQFTDAKKDYEAVEKMVPEHAYMIYYGLAQVAQKQGDKAAEIRYDQLYLKYAPHNTTEFTNVTQRLRQLEAR